MRKFKSIKILFVIFAFLASNIIGQGLLMGNSLSCVAETVTNPFVKIATGYGHTIAIKTDGSLWAWGYNDYSQLGDGTTTSRLVPKQIISSGVTAIAAGDFHTIAIKTDSSLWAWGANYFGQLGDGTTDCRTIPKQILASGAQAIAGGNGHTLVLKTDGSLWAWGKNGSGQLGDGTTINRTTPKQIIASGVTTIAAGDYHTIAIRTDGSLWAWGRNNYGQLGDGTTTNSLAPKQIIASDVQAIVAGENFSLALKTDGSLWAWGRNNYGQLGDGTKVNSLVPKQIIANGVQAIAAGNEHTLAIKTDGSLWAWGDNSYGELGDGTITISKIPKQIIANGVSSITAGRYHSLAIKIDGSLWAWGRNPFGQLGDGTTSNKYSPTKVAVPITVKGNFAVISNQSTDGTTTENTGTFSLDNTNPTTENLNSTSYRKDFIKPLNENFLNNISTNNISQSMLITFTIYNVGDTNTFWAFNIETYTYNQITATLKSSGTYSNVWVKTTDYDMSTVDADRITAEFDSNIFPIITEVFGQPSDTDSNSKVNILCFDIKDGFSESGGYVAGYFDPNDLYPYDSFENPNTNQMEIFYIDTYPTMGMDATKDVTKCYDILAHEFQHMVNWNQNIFIENNDPNTDNMSIWLNEALSESASQVYSGNISQSRIDYYNYSTLITNGFSLLNWEGELENYSLSYLFSQYLKEQVGIGNSVFTEVTQSVYNDYRCIEEVIQNYIDPDLTFSEFMTSFRVALLLKRPTGLYGFKGNAGYNTINQKIYTGGATDLEGGGAVVIASDPVSGEITIPSNKGTNIYYFIVQDAPVITIETYETAPTNSDIIVNASIDVGTLNFSTHTFTENGSFDFIATNLMGDTTTTTVTITNIDKTPPVISGVENGNYYDIASISFNEGTALLNGEICDNGTILRNSGAYNLVVTDALDNETNINFTINNTLYLYLDEQLKGLNLNTLSIDFKNLINTLPQETTKIFDINQTEILDSFIVGNGMTAKIMNGETVVNTYTIIIKGDVSGDGDIDIADLVAIKQHLLYIYILEGISNTAGDIGDKGFISISDLIAINKQIIGLQTISQT